MRREGLKEVLLSMGASGPPRSHENSIKKYLLNLFYLIRFSSKRQEPICYFSTLFTSHRT